MNLEEYKKRMQPTQVSILTEQDEEINQTLTGRVDNTLKIDAGKNIFYAYPPHDAIDPVTGKPNPFAEPKVMTYLPAMVIDRDDNGKEKKDANGNVLKKLGVKPVFNAKIHGKKDSQGNPLGKDLVDEFIRIANEIAKLKFPNDKEKREEFLIPVYGKYAKDASKRINGITYTQAWEMYADKLIGNQLKFGRLSFGKAVKNGLNKAAATEAANEVLGTDPFTPIVDAKGIVIVSNPNAEKPEDYYSVSIDTTMVPVEVGGRTIQSFRLRSLSDDQILHFYKQESLASIFRNQFTRRDLDLQIEGLQLLDEKMKQYRTQASNWITAKEVMETDEFQTAVADLLALYPKEEVPAPPSTTNSVAAEAIAEQEAVETGSTGDMFDLMSREELKEFARDNQTGVLILPTMSDTDLRDKLRSWYENQSTAAPAVKSNTSDEFKKLVGDEPTDIGQPGGTEIKKPLSAKERLEQLGKKPTT